MEGSYTYAPWVMTKRYNATPVELTGYTGMFWIWTTDANGCKRATTGDDCEVIAKIGYLGSRARFTLPIPWFGPYIESGIGVSLGRLRTALDSSDHRVDGAALHVPLGLGVQLGPEHEVEVGLLYLFHPKARQTDGSLGIGLSYPIP
jgi:opacity protein-like surface antigen